jgi:hypothetical protein
MRACANPACRKSIHACFGFVIARDFLAAIAGKIPYASVRELCGLCVFRFEDKPSQLEDLLNAA